MDLVHLLDLATKFVWSVFALAVGGTIVFAPLANIAEHRPLKENLEVVAGLWILIGICAFGMGLFLFLLKCIWL